jgi:hypothetical protein
MAQERQAMPWGSDAKNFLEQHWRVVTLAIDEAQPVRSHQYSIPQEIERGRIDVCRRALAICQWIRAVKAATGQPRNLLPRFPALAAVRQRPLFRPTGASFDIAAWCAANVDTLLDSRKCRVVEHDGRARLKVRPGALSEADLKICKLWHNVICDFVASSFVDVDDAGLRGLMAA